MKNSHNLKQILIVFFLIAVSVVMITVSVFSQTSPQSPDIALVSADDKESASMAKDDIWDVREGWKVLSADSLSVETAGESFSWNKNAKLVRTWVVSADIDIQRMNKGIGTSRIVFGGLDRRPIIIVGVEHHITGISQITMSVPGRAPIMSLAIPGGDSKYAVIISSNGDSIRVVVYGNKGLMYTEETPKIADILDSITAFGLGSLASGITFSNVKCKSPAPKPGQFTLFAESAMNDLMKNYWIGGPDDGYIVSTYNGYPGAEFSPMPKGSMWERCQILLTMDTYYQATGDLLIKRRIAAEWKDINRIFSKDELTAAGSIVHPACDDSGWDGLTYMMIYKDLGDTSALEAAKGLINNAFARWLDEDFGGGMKYDNRKMKSLYQVGVANCALQIWEATGDKSFYDRAMNCYNWMESHLLRPDGLYWCEFDDQGPLLKDRYNDIFEGGSVSFLGGNMGMAVLQARLYRITRDGRYLQRAIRTANGIYQRESKKGIYLNDRDAWSNGTFAGMWAKEVLSLPGMNSKHKKMLCRTAESIFKNDRTPDGHYGGCWGGPIDGPNSSWGIRGFRPQQIMTSASTANMIMGAALSEKAR